MYVQKLTLTNVRQFKDDSFRFQPGFNLIVGENGAGKTTILRSLYAVLGHATQNRRKAGLTDEDITYQMEALELSADVVDLASSRTFRPTYRKQLWKTARRSSNGLKPPVLLYSSNESACSSFISERVKRYRSFEAQDVRSREEDLYEAEMSEPEEYHRGARFGRSQAIRAFVARVLSTFSHDFTNFGWRFEPYDCSIRPPIEDAKPPESFDSVRDTLRRAIMRRLQERRKRPIPWPDRRMVLINWDGFLVEEEERMNRPPIFEPRDILYEVNTDKSVTRYLESCKIELRLTPRIVIRTHSGPLYLNQLSDGQQRLFSLFVDVARELSLRDAPHRIHEASAIVLIDEIDVHLHPKWQRMIVPALEDLFPACQFIATTHSPFVVQATPAGKVKIINGLIADDFMNRGIEEITVKVMGIEDHQVSARYLHMLDAAKEYFRVLEQGDKANADTKAALRSRLRELSNKYPENPAYQAYLEMYGHSRLGPDELR